MSPRISYTNKEVELLARIIRAEALGEGEEGMLQAGNVVVNRVVATCDVFKRTMSITDVIYQKNAFSGVGTTLFNSGVRQIDLDLAKRLINGYRTYPAYRALWFKNPGKNVTCPPEFYGVLAGKYRQHCFYNPKDSLNCNI